MKLTSVERIERSQLIPGVRPTVGEQHEEAAPGVSTARGVSGSDAAAAAPPKWVLGGRLQPIQARLRVSRELPSRPTADRGGQVRLAFVPAQLSGRAVRAFSQGGAPQLRRACQLERRAVSRPPGSRRRRGKRESGVRSGVLPGWLAPGPWGLEGEAVEQADAADEGRLEARRGVVVGAFRGRAVIVGGSGRSRPSQLIRSVGLTCGRERAVHPDEA